MKRITLLIALVALSLFCVAQEDDNIINYFEVGKNIAKPVTIKTNLGTFEIYGGESIRGNIWSLSAYDANGNLIVQNSWSESNWGRIDGVKFHFRYYRFTMIYESSISNPPNNENNNENNSNNTNTGSTGTEIGHRIGKAMNDFAKEASQVPMKGYPNTQVRIGYSWDKYEFIGLHYEYGGMGGGYLSAAIGKDISVIDNDAKLRWMASIGWYGGNKNNTVDFGVFFGTGFTKGISPFDYKKNKEVKFNPDNVSMGFELMYSHWFSFHPRLGMYMIAHGGMTLSKDFGLVYDFKAGMAYKISMGEKKSKKHTGYPNLQLRAGWFSHKSEFLGLHWEFGDDMFGGYLSGTIGKDLSSDSFDNDINWMASFGFFIGGKLNTFNMGLIAGNGFTSGIYGRSMRMESIDPYILSIGMELAYCHWFSFHPQLGLFVVGQGGMAVEAFTNEYIVGGIRVGVSYKIFHKHDN